MVELKTRLSRNSISTEESEAVLSVDVINLSAADFNFVRSFSDRLVVIDRYYLIDDLLGLHDASQCEETTIFVA